MISGLMLSSEICFVLHSISPMNFVFSCAQLSVMSNKTAAVLILYWESAY